ncbi:MAG: hypothetical protein ABIZ04_17730 [Opitutus sp.]
MRLSGVILGLVLCAAVASAADDPIDQLDDLLTFGSSDGRIRGRISGTLELEGYVFPQPAPALIDSSGDALFNPRFTTFLDLQLGSWVYAFAQARADRGFDPGDESPRARLDEYAIRFSPSHDGAMNLQIGKFATVVGNWIARHGAWDNPFVSAPLPYEELTGMWDQVAVRSATILRGWAHVAPPALAGVPAADKYLRLPVIWGPSYTTGVAISGRLGRITYAAEVKNAALASRPESWRADDKQWRHPTVSGRIGFVPNPMWNLGVSASDGVYLQPRARPTIAPGLSFGDFRQTVFGQDLSFAWHHLQLWAEVYEARFAIPRVGNADTFSYYIEAKYKFTPQWFGAVRWNEQLYGRISNGAAGSVRWGSDVWRADVASGYRFTPHLQLKVQYSLQHEEDGPRDFVHILSAQLSLRF